MARAARPTLRFASSSSSSSSSSQNAKGATAKLIGIALSSAIVAAGATYYATNSFSPARNSSIQKDWTLSKYGDKQAFDRALPELQRVLGDDHVTMDKDELHRHGYSEWSTVNSSVLPIAVVYPANTEQVSQVAKICWKYKIPMIGFSGGSSLEGNFCAPYGGICIDFARMDKILQVRPDDMDATVQPSVGWMDLNAHLKDQNLFLGIDPGPTAKLGGMVSTSCSGTSCVRYGPMPNHIVNLTVVLADGTIIKTRGRPRKSSAGYNLNSLFCGSEGTLGLVTEVTVKLQVVPEETSVAVATFDEVKQATKSATDILRAGVPVSAIELMDEVQMDIINKAGFTKRVWDVKPTLFIKFGGTQSYVKEQIAQAKALCKQNANLQFDFTKNEQEQHQLWDARKQALWSAMAVGPPDAKVYSTDVAVPMSQLAGIVAETKKDLLESGVFSSVLGHVGDGNFHASILYTDDQKEKVHEIAKRMVKRGLELEGTCTGEHGVGLGKRELLVDELGPDAVYMMRTLKLAIDPYELLNPGKVFSKETMGGTGSH